MLLEDGMKKTITILLTSFALGALLTGCPEEGPIEKAGKKVDEAAESVRDAVKKDGPMEKAGEKIDDAVEDIKDKLEE